MSEAWRKYRFLPVSPKLLGHANGRSGGQSGETGTFTQVTTMPKYEVIVRTHGYERRIIEADSEDQAREKASVGMGEMEKWEYGIRDSDSESWDVYPSEE